jgi:D-arabinose 1-dehydrogenase-like Zn-dependent alcohol dehydrogenase
MLCHQNSVTGASFPGGFAEKVLAQQSALARIPDGLSFVDAAPLACAGVTTFNSTSGSVAEQLQKFGGARVVVATAANADAMSATVDGLTTHGEILVLAVAQESLRVTPVQLISRSATVHGHASGAVQDIEDTMNFAELHGIRPMVETMPLTHATRGYERMMDNKARFRVVLTTD